MRRRPFVAAALVALVAAGVAVEALPGAENGREPRIRAVRAKADAFVSGANRAKNFGRVPDLRVDAAPTLRTYVRFNVELHTGDVQHVSLLVYSRTHSRLGCRVRVVEDFWREQRITFLNAPTLSAEFVTCGRLKPRAWKAIDVTMLALDVNESEEFLSLAVTAMSPKAKPLELASRETGLYGPRLVVERETDEQSTTSTEAEDKL